MEAMATIAIELLDRLTEESGAKVEIDAEGSIVVTPASDAHVVAASELLRQLAMAAPPGVRVVAEGPRWAPLGGTSPSYVPDIAVVEATALRRGSDDYGLHPSPLLVVEVLSPESRRRDLREKADAYWRGGATAYWTVELPDLSPVERPTLSIRRRGASAWEPVEELSGSASVDAPFTLGLELDRLAL
jgi:Uma2 family endonuclease